MRTGLELGGEFVGNRSFETVPEGFEFCDREGKVQ